MKVESMENAIQKAPVKQVKGPAIEHADVATKTIAKSQQVPLASSSRKKTGESELSGDDEGRGKEVSENTVREAVSNVNRKMTSARCEFAYHEGTHRVSIKVIDKDSDEIIREIPPEKSLDMLQKLWEAAGLFVDEQK